MVLIKGKMPSSFGQGFIVVWSGTDDYDYHGVDFDYLL